MASQPPTPPEHNQRRSLLDEVDLETTTVDSNLRYSPSTSSKLLFGQVIVVAWEDISEFVSSTNNGHTGAQQLIPQQYRAAESTKRLLIAVQPKTEYSWCVPICSYNGLGLTAPGLPREAKHSHAIVHNDNEEPRQLFGETRMRKRHIGLSLHEGRDLINSGSRVDFGCMHRVYRNTQLRTLGQVNDGAMPYLRRYALEAVRTCFRVAP